MVRDSETVVLGGLFTETTTATRRQVPFFGDIPVIGAAFRGHEDQTRRSEIIFMITPSLINDAEAAMAGEAAQDYTTYQRDGARRGLLPWSRERRSSQLLIRARELANEGDVERAMHCIDRALRLHPQNARARAMKAELSGQEVVLPSNSILDAVWGSEFRIAPGGKTDSMSSPGVHREVNAEQGQAPAEPTDESFGMSEGGFDSGFGASGKTGGEQTGEQADVVSAGADVTPVYESFEESFDQDPIAEVEGDEFQSGEFEQGEVEQPWTAPTDESESETADAGQNPWVEYIDVSPRIDPQVDDQADGFADPAVSEAQVWENSPEAEVQLTDEFGQTFQSPEAFEQGAWDSEDQAIESFFEDQLEAFEGQSETNAGPNSPEFGPEAQASPAIDAYPESVGPFFSPFFPRSVFETSTVSGPQSNGSNQAGASLDMFGAQGIEGLQFENQGQVSAQWGTSTGPILGPILAPAGSEVLWIPIPDGRMLRIPLVEGDFEVMERGYPLESEQYADAPTDDDIND